MTTQIQLTRVSDLSQARIVSRPSKSIKSPYVADVHIEGTDEICVAHTPSLGCCGLADKDATVIVSKIHKKNNKCKYKVILSIFTEKNKQVVIGIDPKQAELLAEKALANNLLSKLQNIKRYSRETTIFVENKVDSRFDFTGIDQNNIPFIMEVKNVPLADYEDITYNQRKHANYDDRNYDTKVAYFPDGYRKKSTDTVSPRALKHIRELTLIKRESITRCILCFVIQRNDVDRFQPSIVDPQYREAFVNAVDAGVEIITLVVSWNTDGQACFIRDDLPISL